MSGNEPQIEHENKKSNTTSRKRSNDEHLSEKIPSKRRRHDPIVAMVTNRQSSSSQKNERSIDDLPYEMLKEVLYHVPSGDLLKCRQINRQWFKISSEIMRQRNDVQLRFGSNTDSVLKLTIKARRCEPLLVNVCRTKYTFDKKSLSDLVDCLTLSDKCQQLNYFPCKSYRFDRLADLGNEQFRHFMTIYGENVSTLWIQLDNVSKNVAVLRDLLRNGVVNLKELQLEFYKDGGLFFQPFVAEFGGWQLPKLETLCVDSSYRRYSDLIQSILAAANNLKHFEIIISSDADEQLLVSPNMIHTERMIDPRHCVTADDLELLQSCNKLHCLQKARIFLTDDLIAYFQTSPSSFDLKLQSLAVSLKKSIWRSETLKPSATKMINRLLLSSENVIQELSVEALGLLHGLVVPKLEQLEKLELFGWISSPIGTKCVNVFPHLFELADNFPNLKELDVHGLTKNTFLQSQPLKPMQNVKTLRLFGGEPAQCKEWLMQATPNAKTLLIAENDFEWMENHKPFVDFGAIAGNLPKLESFGLMICRSHYEDLLHSFDSFFTGFSEDFCKKVSDKFFNKDQITAQELASYQTERRSPSIVDLHHLKQLDITFFFDFDCYCEKRHNDGHECDESDCDGECGEKTMTEKPDNCGNDPFSRLYETGLSKVSKFLAFDLMPDLKVRTHKRYE